MKIFIEQQRFTQTWLIAIIVCSALVPVGILCSTHINNDSTFSIFEFLLLLFIIISSLGVIFLFKLSTRIDEYGIHYQFFPFHFKLKTIQWSDLDKAYIRKYDAITEYGGWGLKGGAFWVKSKGKSINVSGNIGIQLELKNGIKLLIGTKKEQQARQTLQAYVYKINSLDK